MNVTLFFVCKLALDALFQQIDMKHNLYISHLVVDKPSSKLSVVLEIKSSRSHTSDGRQKIGVRNCMCIVATLHLLNVSCKITQQILLPIFPKFISLQGA